MASRFWSSELSYGLYSYGLYSYGPYSYGRYSYGRYSYRKRYVGVPILVLGIVVGLWPWSCTQHRGVGLVLGGTYVYYMIQFHMLQVP